MAKGSHRCLYLSGLFHDQGIISAQDGIIFRPLMNKHPHLCPHILLHPVVAIQMIRRQIQKKAYIRPELSGQIKLEAGQFKHQNIILNTIDKGGQKRGADVPADKGMIPATSQQLTDQTGHRGLAVRSGNADHRHGNIAGGKGKLSDNGNRRRPGRPQHRQIKRHPRTGDNDIAPENKILAVSPCFTGKSVDQLLFFFTQGRIRAIFRHGRCNAPALQKTNHCHA